MEYLPTGNRNFMFAVVVPPTGYGVEEMSPVGQDVQARRVRRHRPVREIMRTAGVAELLRGPARASWDLPLSMTRNRSARWWGS